jgi:hypothetical protein
MNKLPPLATNGFSNKTNKFYAARENILLLITYLSLFENTKNGYLADIKVLPHENII